VNALNEEHYLKAV